jgi:hypothetical protein
MATGCRGRFEHITRQELIAKLKQNKDTYGDGL